MKGSFSWQIAEKLFWVNLLGSAPHGELMVRSIANHEDKDALEDKDTLEDKSLTSQQNCGIIYF